jgi:hypothetical protein
MNTQTRKLEPQTWRAYFDWMTRQLPSARAEIEVTGIDIGDQIEGDALSIDGLSYDPSSRELVITATADEIEHHIADPKEIYVLEELGQPSAIEILDGAGYKQIVHITPLLELPPPPV